MVEWETPPWKTLNCKDIDSGSQENYQEEHVKFDPPVSLQHLTLQNGMIETNCQRQGQ